MSKHDSTSDQADDTEASITDTDAVQIADAEPETAGSSDIESVSESEPETEPVSEPAPTSKSEAVPEPAPTSKSKSEAVPEPAPTTKSEVTSQPGAPKPGRSWFGLFNFLLILGLAAGAGYYWWQQQQVAHEYKTAIAELKQQLAGKAGNAGLNARLDASLSPLKGDIGSLDGKIEELGLVQQELRASSEKLYELFGRDKSDWQFAEVEYLMRVAQHKLILQDDFEGAAITLQAASDKIGLTGDPGMLSVRVMISDEIADLKTRRRADLVGMTLILAQLGRQVRVLKPGFAMRIDETQEITEEAVQVEMSQDWFDRFSAFIDSLVEVRNEAIEPGEIEANTADVGESLEDNLKLARWTVLERDASQYQLLLDQSIRLFREFYDLDNAANHDFMTQLQELQKMVLKPEKPDITGSLYELRRILSQRENAPPVAPEPAATETTESGNG